MQNNECRPHWQLRTPVRRAERNAEEASDSSELELRTPQRRQRLLVRQARCDRPIVTRSDRVAREDDFSREKDSQPIGGGKRTTVCDRVRKSVSRIEQVLNALEADRDCHLLSTPRWAAPLDDTPTEQPTLNIIKGGREHLVRRHPPTMPGRCSRRKRDAVGQYQGMAFVEDLCRELETTLGSTP